MGTMVDTQDRRCSGTDLIIMPLLLNVRSFLSKYTGSEKSNK